MESLGNAALPQNETCLLGHIQQASPEGLIDLWLSCISAFSILLKAENHDEISVLWLIYVTDVTSTVIYQKSEPFGLNATCNTGPFNPGPCRSIPKCECKLHTISDSIVSRNSYYYILMAVYCNLIN